MERYDDNYNPTEHVGRRRNTRKTFGSVNYEIEVPGVNGVMLPNNLTKKQYDEYVAARSGPVKIIKEGE